MRAIALGGPSTVSGTISFNGATCTIPGTLAGDLLADNISQSTVRVVAGTVPLKLTDFSAKNNNCQGLLNWTSENEENTSSFEIERSNCSSNNWTSVGTVLAKVNSQTKSEYSFTDKNIEGFNGAMYYRLKMLDKDGTFKYSKVTSASFSCTKPKVSVFPMPIKDGRLQVTASNLNGISNAVLMSVSGQIVSQQTIKNGSNTIDVSGLASGMYILKVTDESGYDEKIKVSIDK